MTPPPGWYRDPSAPHLERWWDGMSWTDHRRTPGAPPDRPPAPAPPAFATPVPTPPTRPLAVRSAPPAGGRPARGKAIALAGAGAVLVASAVTGVVLLGRGGDAATTATTTTATPGDRSATSAAPAPASPSPSATGDPSRVVDQLNGVTLPLPHGWERPQYVSDDDVIMTTHGTYDCPAGGGFCRHGLVSTKTPNTAETSPRALAESDIEDAADTAYDQNAAGQRLYDGITSHRAVASGPVAVAGRAGYYVRWRVRTAKGPGGYVESLAFASSTGTEAPVVVRFAFDAGPDGPPLSDMDKITKGIRAVGDAATGGGVGSSLGPST
ncbi:DUF2510 domain-containing protein [Streptomyces sp. NPDC047017]|uniref:DUF2510 domain-containing protein n=1 Tax=Streptomyces sp. NPDC047017 TaxID=3155024 RepID=UPI0033FCA203